MLDQFDGEKNIDNVKTSLKLIANLFDEFLLDGIQKDKIHDNEELLQYLNHRTIDFINRKNIVLAAYLEKIYNERCYTSISKYEMDNSKIKEFVMFNLFPKEILLILVFIESKLNDFNINIMLNAEDNNMYENCFNNILDNFDIYTKICTTEVKIGKDEECEFILDNIYRFIVENASILLHGNTYEGAFTNNKFERIYEILDIMEEMKKVDVSFLILQINKLIDYLEDEEQKTKYRIIFN
jgi:hypothetical protein